MSRKTNQEEFSGREQKVPEMSPQIFCLCQVYKKSTYAANELIESERPHNNRKMSSVLFPPSHVSLFSSSIMFSQVFKHGIKDNIHIFVVQTLVPTHLDLLSGCAFKCTKQRLGKKDS